MLLAVECVLVVNILGLIISLKRFYFNHRKVLGFLLCFNSLILGLIIYTGIWYLILIAYLLRPSEEKKLICSEETYFQLLKRYESKIFDLGKEIKTDSITPIPQPYSPSIKSIKDEWLTLQFKWLNFTPEVEKESQDKILKTLNALGFQKSVVLQDISRLISQNFDLLTESETRPSFNQLLKLTTLPSVLLDADEAVCGQRRTIEEIAKTFQTGKVPFASSSWLKEYSSYDLESLFVGIVLNPPIVGIKNMIDAYESQNGDSWEDQWLKELKMSLYEGNRRYRDGEIDELLRKRINGSPIIDLSTEEKEKISSRLLEIFSFLRALENGWQEMVTPTYWSPFAQMIDLVFSLPFGSYACYGWKSLMPKYGLYSYANIIYDFSQEKQIEELSLKMATRLKKIMSNECLNFED